MKKLLIASAITAATFSGLSMAATTEQAMNVSDLAARMDAMPTIYGNIQLAWDFTSVKEAGQNRDSSNSGIDDNGTTIGFKHSSEIAPGVKGFYKLEIDHLNADNKATSSGLAILTKPTWVLKVTSSVRYGWVQTIPFMKPPSTRSTTTGNVTAATATHRACTIPVKAT